MGLTFFAGGSMIAAAFTTSLDNQAAPAIDTAVLATPPAAVSTADTGVVLAGFSLLDFLRDGGKPRTPTLAPDNGDDHTGIDAGLGPVAPTDTGPANIDLNAPVPVPGSDAGMPQPPMI